MTILKEIEGVVGKKGLIIGDDVFSRKAGIWIDDGIKAVEMGIASMNNITNHGDAVSTKVTAHSSKSADNLLDLVLNSATLLSNAHVKETLFGTSGSNWTEECKVNVQQ